MSNDIVVNNGVLVNVDDNEPTRYARNRILTAAGFTVYDAERGKEALSLFDKYDPNLVLLDVHMPDMNGLEVCRRLREKPKGGSVIVVQITASALTPAHATAALDNGADAYLTEPVDPDVLVATVRAMLRLHRAEGALVEANQRLEAVNKELQQSNEDLRQFAFAASQELEGPLRFISSLSQLVQTRAADRLTDREKAQIADVSAAAKRMPSLIQGLLAYSQVEQQHAGKRVVKLRSVMDRALDNLRESMEQTRASIEIPSSLPQVWGDEEQLGQLIENLLSNALKFAKPDLAPFVEIKTQQIAPGEWMLSVRDNGIGIDPAYWQLIFAPLRRLHGQEVPGTGLGLAVCKRILETHGGRIWVESELGVGTTFFITLPGPARSSAAKH